MTGATRKHRPALKIRPEPAAAEEGPCCERAEWMAAALQHLEIGVRAAGVGLPVNWEYVSYRIGRALRGQDEQVEAEEAWDL